MLLTPANARNSRAAARFLHRNLGGPYPLAVKLKTRVNVQDLVEGLCRVWA